MTDRASRIKRWALLACGTAVVPAIWLIAKYVVGVGDRYLPSPIAVLRAVNDIDPPILVHTLYTATRLSVGFVAGVIVGIGLALTMVRRASVAALVLPSVQALRSVPSAAVVPFFLLWFGFSEIGRYLLVVSAVAFNTAVASWQILGKRTDAHQAFFASFGIAPGQLPLKYCLPRIAEDILPTLRFSLALSIGAVTVSEVLGSQVGLGYLIQTSRATFSLHVLFLATIVLGAMSAIADGVLVGMWQRFVYWRRLQ